jgi:hypothetical protein
VTLSHEAKSNPTELIGNMNIEISKGRGRDDEQTIMVLFAHQVKTVVAELSYKSVKK